MNHTKRKTGTIYNLVLQRGFGFLVVDADRSSLFFHIREFNGKVPKIGDVVSFEIGEDSLRRPVAINISIEVPVSNGTGAAC
jgi:cold shock CspA family protein